MDSYPRSPASRSARGFTLVEALVALLVLAIGLLGVAGMQLKSLQSAHAGYQRAIASLAAQDAVEILWSGVDMTSSTCPPISLLEKRQWVTRWQTFLPSLQKPIASDPTEDCTYDIRVEWNEQRFGDVESSPVFTYRARLPKGTAGS